MGDQNTVLLAADIRHLLRRTGFGSMPADVEKFTGLTRGQAADQLLNFKTTRPFKPRGNEARRLRDSWLKYMLRTKLQFQEKLVLFWHDHFASASSKVYDASEMAMQNRLLRQFCKGNFRAFVKAINKDAAMMEYLDTVRNHAEQPNENYARELQELFTLGVRDLNGNPTYSQADIVQIARAFSGWDTDRKNRAVFEDYDHDFMIDYPGRGPKVIYQAHGGFGGGGADYTLPGGEGAAEIDQVTDIIFQHVDSDGENTVARHITKKLLEYFCYASPSKALIDELIATSGFNTLFELTPLLRAMICHDEFYATAAPAPFTGATKKSVKWPVDYVVTVMRAFKMQFRQTKYDLYINGDFYANIHNNLEQMGQLILEPPSVFGWDWEAAWLSSATLLSRFEFARNATNAYGSGRMRFHPEKLIDLDLTAPADIVDAVTNYLGVTDQFPAAQRQALIDYLGAGPIDLHDYDTRAVKLNGLFTLVLQSPAYQLH